MGPALPPTEADVDAGFPISYYSLGAPWEKHTIRDAQRADPKYAALIFFLENHDFPLDSSPEERNLRDGLRAGLHGYR